MIKTNNDITDVGYNFDRNVHEGKLLPLIHTINFSYDVVTEKNVGRPDLLSLLNYETEDLDWVLMLFNGFRSEDFKFGTVFKVPNKSELYFHLVK